MSSIPVGSIARYRMGVRQYTLTKILEDGCCSEWRSECGTVYLLSDRKIREFKCFVELSIAPAAGEANA